MERFLEKKVKREFPKRTLQKNMDETDEECCPQCNKYVSNNLLFRCDKCVKLGCLSCFYVCEGKGCKTTYCYDCRDSNYDENKMIFCFELNCVCIKCLQRAWVKAKGRDGKDKEMERKIKSQDLFLVMQNISKQLDLVCKEAKERKLLQNYNLI